MILSEQALQREVEVATMQTGADWVVYRVLRTGTSHLRRDKASQQNGDGFRLTAKCWGNHHAWYPFCKRRSRPAPSCRVLDGR